MIIAPVIITIAKAAASAAVRKAIQEVRKG